MNVPRWADGVCRSVAKAGRALGPLSVTWTDACEQPGGRPRPGRLRIETQVERREEIGGGLVAFSGFVDLGGNSDYADGLNAIGRATALALTDCGRLLAMVATAFDDRRRAQQAQRDAEERLAATLRGGRVMGRLHVSLEVDGGVWLLDPEKRGAGWGLRYPSLAALWRDHPELRPVEWGTDERGAFLTVEPFVMVEDSP